MKRVLSAVLCVVLVLGFSSCRNETKEPEKEECFCEVDGGKIKVLSLYAADGAFVEKGEKDEVSGVAAIVVRNDSGQMLEYGTIVFTVNDTERARFVISALPDGEQCVVMETDARPFASEDKYVVNDTDSLFAYCDQSVEGEEYTINVDGSKINVTNNTDKPLNVYVNYKYFKDEMFYGGIAFRGRFENIAPHQMMSKTSDYFDNECRIVNVITDEVK